MSCKGRKEKGYFTKPSPTHPSERADVYSRYSRSRLRFLLGIERIEGFPDQGTFEKCQLLKARKEYTITGCCAKNGEVLFEGRVEVELYGQGQRGQEEGRATSQG